VEYDENGNEHEQGYLHVDVTYLPKFEGNKSYLFVAIDKANQLTCRSEKKTARINPFSGRRKTCGEQS
jgi:transposase-like protein